MPFESPVSRSVTPLILDVVAVVAFATLGARTHHEGALSIGAVADVAWPFLVALGAIHALGRRTWRIAFGLKVWVGTVVGGMVIRQLTGDGTAIAFVIVATCFTLATLVGWRVVAALIARGRTASA